MDAQDFPDLVDCCVFCDDDAAYLMQYWSGLSQEAVYAYLYEEFIYIASCGLLAGKDEDDCKRAIVARHAAWFGPAGKPPATAVTVNGPIAPGGAGG